MQTYSFTEARQNLASVLDEANKKGGVRINRSDGQAFILKPVPITGSPLDIKGIYTDISTDEIVDIISESRERF
ncbi:MAG: type II toxin-antitoxin system Phd/YefM family antitoxin [Methylococcaceae bacterium]|nr:type II toxin-antitoxin system Phd/YefM family antitoxin [Methylococcaceae bacterium]